jgi:glucoamylase
MGPRSRLTVAGVVLALVVPLGGTVAAAPAVTGVMSHFGLARKDCVGTARNTTSKVWYTVAGGVLSDVYEPTVDTTNVQTLQFVVTDGRTFTDLQGRDMSYTVAADRTGMVCTVTSTARSGRYRLTTTYLTDPARDSVVIRTRLQALRGAARDLSLYVRVDPTVGGNGGGGDPAAGGNAGADNATVDEASGALVSWDTGTVTAAVNRDYGVPTFLALRADRPFRAATSGYAGDAGDGLVQLDRDRALTAPRREAADGNVTQTALLATTGGVAELALGFGRNRAAAVRTAGATLGRPFTDLRAEYVAGWDRYDRGLRPLPASVPGVGAARLRRLHAAGRLGLHVVKAAEDKTFPGAIAAALASPWGQAVPAGQAQNGLAPYFGSYREVFSRDLYEAFTALLVAGDLRTARAATRFLLERQQLPDGRLPRNSLLNGKAAPDTGGDQLDETAYPLLMAWQAGLGGDAALYRDHLRGAADFLVAHGPAFGVERWEEQTGYSPSTIAAEIAGLVAVAQLARRHGDEQRAGEYLAVADRYQRSVKDWTVTADGGYAPGRYFLRLSRSGDPNAAISYDLGNGGPAADQRAVIDGGFQELTRLGILPAADPDVLASLTVVDATIGRETPRGPGFYRYGTSLPGTEDGYGDCHVPDPTDCAPEGKPWPGGPPEQVNRGSGHLWPVLAGERAEQELQLGHTATAVALLEAMHASASGVGLVPEQSWENAAYPPDPYLTDPGTASIGFTPGGPAGSAAPLTWAQAQAVRLLYDLGAGRVLEQPAVVRDRYAGSR